MLSKFNKKKYNKWDYLRKNKKDIIRIIVFVDDTRPGHQLWIKDMLCAGEAGSYFGWKFGTKHMAANLGEQDRYTLQITGIKN